MNFLLRQSALNTASILNRAQAVVFLVAMIFVLSLCAWMIGGIETVIVANAMVVLSLTITRRLGVGAVMRLHRALPVDPRRLPEVYRTVAGLARKAGLPSVPSLYWTPSEDVNAFTAGDADGAGIAVTDGALRHLSMRELAGVLAHEIAHLAASDTRLMFLTEVVRSVTANLSIAGLLVIVYLDLAGAGHSVPGWMTWVFALAPMALLLLQTGFSRSREFAADFAGARLTGDPLGLASALWRIERLSRWRWPWALVAGRVFSPSLFHTHPPTSKRVARLMAQATGTADTRAVSRRLSHPAPVTPTRPRRSVPIIVSGPHFPSRGFRP